jgi:hypothetical protein
MPRPLYRAESQQANTWKNDDENNWLKVLLMTLKQKDNQNTCMFSTVHNKMQIVCDKNGKTKYT